MPVATLEALKEQLAFTGDIGTVDDAMLDRKLAAAENHVERLLGFRLAERFGADEPVPPALVEAVLMLAAWWYENREAASDTARELPFGVRDIVTEFREFTF